MLPPEISIEGLGSLRTAVYYEAHLNKRPRGHASPGNILKPRLYRILKIVKNMKHMIFHDYMQV